MAHSRTCHSRGGVHGGTCAASSSTAILVNLPSIPKWAQLNSEAAERLIWEHPDASPYWKPQGSRTPGYSIDPVTQFAAFGVYRNKAADAAPGTGSVRAHMRSDPDHYVSVPARRVHLATYEGVRSPHEDGQVDVRCLQLMRDVAQLLRDTAFEGHAPASRVPLHPATITLLHHLGFPTVVPMGVLVVLLVWVCAHVKHPDVHDRQTHGSKPWHDAVAASIGEAWDLFQHCTWHSDAGLAEIFMSVLAALPRVLLLRYDTGFDRELWECAQQELCPQVGPPAPVKHALFTVHLIGCSVLLHSPSWPCHVHRPLTSAHDWPQPTPCPHRLSCTMPPATRLTAPCACSRSFGLTTFSPRHI